MIKSLMGDVGIITLKGSVKQETLNSGTEP